MVILTSMDAMFGLLLNSVPLEDDTGWISLMKNSSSGWLAFYCSISLIKKVFT